MVENENEARANMLQSLQQLFAFNKENPNTMIVQFFMQGKSTEIIGIFKKGSVDEKAKLVELMNTLDVINATKYKQELQ
jgi:hypothetical protein